MPKIVVYGDTIYGELEAVLEAVLSAKKIRAPYLDPEYRDIIEAYNEKVSWTDEEVGLGVWGLPLAKLLVLARSVRGIEEVYSEAYSHTGKPVMPATMFGEILNPYILVGEFKEAGIRVDEMDIAGKLRLTAEFLKAYGRYIVSYTTLKEFIKTFKEIHGLGGGELVGGLTGISVDRKSDFKGFLNYVLATGIPLPVKEGGKWSLEPLYPVLAEKYKQDTVLRIGVIVSSYYYGLAYGFRDLVEIVGKYAPAPELFVSAHVVAPVWRKLWKTILKLAGEISERKDYRVFVEHNPLLKIRINISEEEVRKRVLGSLSLALLLKHVYLREGLFHLLGDKEFRETYRRRIEEVVGEVAEEHQEHPRRLYRKLKQAIHPYPTTLLALLYSKEEARRLLKTAMVSPEEAGSEFKAKARSYEKWWSSSEKIGGVIGKLYVD